MPVSVLINAGPWLSVPPTGYGGIENVLTTLIGALRKRGVQVTLASVGDSSIEVDRLTSVFPTGQFSALPRPYREVMGIAHAHMQCVLAEIRSDDYDLVHDHLEVVGASVLGAADLGIPVLQTLHWSLRKHPEFYSNFDGGGQLFFNGLSHGQVAEAPEQLIRQIRRIIPLATEVDSFEPATEKSDFLLTLGRLTPDKGYDIAARLCREEGLRLIMAGPVASARHPQELDDGLRSETVRNLRDVQHYLNDIQPHLDGTVDWVGMASGGHLRRLLREARAVLFPLRWTEPGGTAAIEALACGTPIVAMRRGALAEIVDHGRTGFLADSEPEFREYLKRVDELDPVGCRQDAEQRFTPNIMGDAYLDLYGELIDRRRTSRSVTSVRPSTVTN